MSESLKSEPARKGPKPWKEADEYASGASVSGVSGFSGTEMEGVLGVVLTDGPLAREELVLSRAQSRWPQAAGSLAKHSWPERFSNGRLTVRMSSDAYAQDFMMYRLDILKKLRGFGIVEIETLFLQKGKATFKDRVPNAGLTDARVEQDSSMSEAAHDLVEGLKKIRGEA